MHRSSLVFKKKKPKNLSHDNIGEIATYLYFVVNLNRRVIYILFCETFGYCVGVPAS